VAYFTYERLPKNSGGKGFSIVAPNLIVEVIGKGQGWGGLVEKAGEYLRMGTDRIWIIDPKTRRLHIYRADAEPAVLNFDDVLADEVILPGFSCRVADLFED
jgi:Uma2 family endonuclease